MLLDRLRAPAPGAALCKFGMAVAALWPSAFASAQTASPGASTSAAELTPAERAKRDGDQVFHWILIHSDKPRKPTAPKDEKPAAAVTHVKPPARTAARTDDPAPAASAVAVAAPAASAAPARATVAAAAAAAKPATAAAVAPVVTAASAAVKLATASLTTPAVPAAAAVVEDDAPESLKPLSQTEPKFPINLIRSLRTGQVQVKFTVLPDGSVGETEVLSSSHPRLNPSALAAVAQWRFAPLRKPQHGVVDLGFNNAD